MPFGITALTRNIIYLEPTNMSHMRYIPVIIGIYICLPLVSNGLATTDKRILKYPLIIACIYLFIVPELNVLLRSLQVDTISSLIDFSFIGGVYGIYLIIGYLVKQGSFIRVNKLWWMTIGGISFIFTVFIQIYSYKANVGYNVWYNNATLAITALSLFMLLSQIKFSQSKIIENISKCSFGIFIMHNPIKMILMRYVTIHHNSIKIAVITILTMLFSWLIVYTVSKINKTIARVLFLF